MFPSGGHTERVAVRDDVIPLKSPVVGNDGKILDSLHVRKGQVSAVLAALHNATSYF
jgi:hypothetical protein